MASKWYIWHQWMLGFYCTVFSNAASLFSTQIWVMSSPVACSFHAAPTWNSGITPFLYYSIDIKPNGIRNAEEQIRMIFCPADFLIVDIGYVVHGKTIITCFFGNLRQGSTLLNWSMGECHNRAADDSSQTTTALGKNFNRLSEYLPRFV